MQFVLRAIRWALFAAGFTALLGSGGGFNLAAAADDFSQLEREYSDTLLPVVQKLCVTCHSTSDQAGELDLEQFASFANLRHAPAVWVKVAEMLANGEMPPEDALQPTAAEREQLASFVDRFLAAEALANAGDPGPTVLRRLTNAEYTYTLRDLTGAPLDPAREFPADGAAGEGFTNSGGALVMSPALLEKYFAAAKSVAAHAVLLPDGMRFSPFDTRSDWTNEVLQQIRAFYGRFADAEGSTQVNLQGIIFETNGGGRLPVERYLAALLAERDALRSGERDIATVAQAHSLNARYLGLLWQTLQATSEDDSSQQSLLLRALRRAFAQAAAEDAHLLTGQISAWQRVLTRFQSVGHLKQWMVPVSPVAAAREMRLKVEPSANGATTFYFTAGDAGDGAEGDLVLWQQPRLVRPGRPDLPLRDVRGFMREMSRRRQELLSSTAAALESVYAVRQATAPYDSAELVTEYNVPPAALAAWLELLLGVGADGQRRLDWFTKKIENSSGYDFVDGWGFPETPVIVANSSDTHVRIPGNMKPHGVCVHPSPTLYACVGWQSPVSGKFEVSGAVTHAHPECGNGVTWQLELRRGATRQRLAEGVAQGGTPVTFGPLPEVVVQPGDLLSLLIGPRDGNHACDLTDVELVVRATDQAAQQWSLTSDVSPDILAGNPHADSHGNENVWHFYTEPIEREAASLFIPPDCVLTRWQAASTKEEADALALAVEQLLLSGPAADAPAADVELYQQLTSLGGPLCASLWHAVSAAFEQGAADQVSPGGEGGNAWGLSLEQFGRAPDGTPVDPLSLCVQAPSVLAVELPADLLAGAELVVTGSLYPTDNPEGSVQVDVATNDPGAAPALRADLPVLVADSGPARTRFERAFADFRDLFPAALCYEKIVPVDEVITLTLFHREDEPLCRLMLSQDEQAELDRLWAELHFVSQDAITIVDAFEQLLEYASQDSDPGLFEPFRPAIYGRADEYRAELVAAEAPQLLAVLDFAARAYRRPATEEELAGLQALYVKLRAEELPHEEALRLTLARVLISPAFLYRLEQAPPGANSAAVNDWELASRLSYFLWSGPPDEELLALAAAGRLHEPAVLAAQARRMLQNPRIRRMATEFACQWLHIYEFDALDEKSEQFFPEFADLRGDMYEEAIRFFADALAHDATVLELFTAEHTFVSARLAEFYGVPFDALPVGDNDDGWRRVDGLQQYGRGGLLGLAAILAKQSGASRTSPILRGNWVSETLLGERLPKPPKDVPQLPNDETATEGLTVRQLVELHSQDERCAKCHQRIDPYGFALEGFDAIGRRRDRDLAGRPIEVDARLRDGTGFSGLEGLRSYLTESQRTTIVRQFSRKLLGYAVGRSVQLSDEPLLTEMTELLGGPQGRLSRAVEMIVQSRQFREIRGADAAIAGTE